MYGGKQVGINKTVEKLDDQEERAFALKSQMLRLSAKT